MSSVSDYNSYRNASQRAQESYETERNQTRANHSKEIDEIKEENEEVLTRQRDAYEEKLAEARESANTEIRKLKEDLYDKSGKRFSEESRELSEQRNQLNEYRDEIKRNGEKQVANAERAAEARGAKSHSNEERKVTEALAAQKRSHLDEVNQLKDELKTYQTNTRDVEKEKAKARSEVVENYENDNIKDRDRIIEAYEGRISRMKEVADEKEAHFKRRLNDTVLESNERTRGQLQGQKQEFTKAELDRRAEARRMEEHFNQRQKQIESKSSRNENNLILQNRENLDRGLAAKDEAYQNYLKSSGDFNRYELTKRDREISELKTTDDPLKVSPYVAQKIQNKSDARNYALLTEAEKNHQEALDAARTRDIEDRNELRDRYAHSHTANTRSMQKQRDLEHKQFSDTFRSLEEAKQDEGSQLRQKFNGERERLAMMNAQKLNQQQRKMRDEMDVQRDTLSGEKANLQEDLELKQKNSDREWHQKLSGYRRTSDKKLTEIQDQSDRMLDEMKYTFDKKLRDQDRLSKKAMEDRVRAYEHQLAQQSATFKERERFLTEQYQEELDSLKRTNARLLQTKS